MSTAFLFLPTKWALAIETHTLITKLSDESRPWVGKTGKLEEYVLMGAGLGVPEQRSHTPLRQSVPWPCNSHFELSKTLSYGTPSPNPPFSLGPFALEGQCERWMDFTSYKDQWPQLEALSSSAWDLTAEGVGPHIHPQYFWTLLFQVHNLFLELLGGLASRHFSGTPLLWLILGNFLCWPWFLHLNFKASYIWRST